MSKKEVYEQKAEALLLPIIEANNFELVDVEYVKEGSNWYLRAYIDKEGGISVDDCEVVSRAFSVNWMKRISLMMLILWRSVPRDLADH